jgi:transcriptional regulator with XRE-family HTH domain
MNVTQCKMARAGLGWSLDDLADHSGMARRSVARFEAGENVRPETVAALQAAMIAAGVAFTNGGGRIGVTVRRSD